MPECGFSLTCTFPNKDRIFDFVLIRGNILHNISHFVPIFRLLSCVPVIHYNISKPLGQIEIMGTLTYDYLMYCYVRSRLIGNN